MGIIALGSKEVQEQVQRRSAEEGNPSLRLQRLIEAINDETVETREHFAAEIQKLGYQQASPAVYGAFRQKSRGRDFQDVKQRLARGAAAECSGLYVGNKFYLEGAKLAVTKARIGEIYLIALASDPQTTAAVRMAFATAFETHGLTVPDYLKPVAAAEARRPRVEHTERPVARRHGDSLPMVPKLSIVMRADGTFYQARKIVQSHQTPEQREAKEKLRVAAKLAKEKRKADKSAAQAAAKKNSKHQSKRK